MEPKRILVIEDQEMPWSNIKIILTQKCGVPEKDIERARWFEEAEAKLCSQKFGIVFLDHRMPYSDPGCTDASDFDRFCASLDNIGYGLFPLIKRLQPDAIVVGTSSLSQHETRFVEVPERKLNKVNMFEELPALMETFR